jgi:hypothetical protein
MVGGAQPAPKFAQAVVMLVGPKGFCSGVAMAHDLVLTAAHCVMPGASYKLVEFDANRKPILKDIASIAHHPKFDVAAARRHRVTADVALLKFDVPISRAPIPLGPASFKVAAGDQLLVAGYGLTAPGDGSTGGVVRTAVLTATGQPGTLQIRLMDPATRNQRMGLGACTGDSGAPVFANIAGALAVIGVVSWATGPRNADGCGGLTGVTPLVRYRTWIVQQAARMGAPLLP